MLEKKTDNCYYDKENGLSIMYDLGKPKNGNGYWLIGPQKKPFVPMGEIHGKVFFRFNLNKIPGGWRFITGETGVWFIDIDGNIDIRKRATFDTNNIFNPPGNLKNNLKVKAVWADDGGKSKIIIVLEIIMRNKTTKLEDVFSYRIELDTKREFFISDGKENDNNGDDPQPEPKPEPDTIPDIPDEDAESEVPFSLIDFIGIYRTIWRGIGQRFRKGHTWIQYIVNSLHALAMAILFPGWFLIFILWRIFF